MVPKFAVIDFSQGKTAKWCYSLQNTTCVRPKHWCQGLIMIYLLTPHLDHCHADGCCMPVVVHSACVVVVDGQCYGRDALDKAMQ